MIRALALGAVIAVAFACTISRRTPSLACTSTQDCSDGRTCYMGYCVNPGSCPSTCTSCDMSTSPPTCTIDGSGTSLTCPSGMKCDITCGSTGACGTISCGSDDCTITCEAAGACGTITCGNNKTGNCSVACETTSSCGSITCNNACTCDVTCATGDCGANSCPVRGTGANQVHCTDTGAGGAPCSSTAQPGCSSC